MEIAKLDETSDLNLNELVDTEGGGFAYDVGRLIRYVYLTGGMPNPVGAYQWHLEGITNDAYQKMN